MNRRRVLYPLIALVAAAVILWFDRHRAPERKPLPRAVPIPYDGPLRMSPGPAKPPPTPAAPPATAPAAPSGSR